ncbi:putative dGTPase [Marvinbryantia formatexigens DSM 14469]|uniref:Deoxyguanosinetriphosphate triphosphohydrolase-like protein n=1 Tax=Marvinbryantia formatexigens DSM 14469 TaxID=478749 RepID=C6LGM3_9FIRM|nr:deoxyguanosinetriphosphate triphosphohydrolase [Marvinbryantia formatexigens]EET60223.1 putative dGTPase [Marvinbryantia formatexigens DSM 14469]UWO24247.1 deoxyguanosinetriphosphate triphosphohydrolase [Marvinbryantia formatexigens DSM 14469]SDF57786.1 dGTPase [Marvinbryantia formatexigens]
MNIREMAEQREEEFLSEYASLSRNTRGRDIQEAQCDIRPVYQRDRDRILHCKSFRRLKHKTQVFLNPQGDHYRDRLTHTLEVSQIARTIAQALRLNESLTEAIAMGHDIGHTPFGHAGERALNRVCPDGFIHSEQSIRVVELLEKKGRGLNLTWEVRDGIRNHRTSGHPATLEGKVVRLSDKIAYINHDIDDAERAGILREEDIPLEYRQVLGSTIKERLNTMIHDIVSNSQGKPDICQSPEVGLAMKNIRKFMFQNVYTNPTAKGEETKAENMLAALYEYYEKHLELLPPEYQDMVTKGGQSVPRVVCDYISGMTDQYAMTKYAEYFIPKAWKL